MDSSKVDVFPCEPDPHFDILDSYPEKGFTPQRRFFVFAIYLGPKQKIYYDVRNFQGKYETHVKFMLTYAKKVEKFKPSKIEFSKIKNKLEKPLWETERVNVDPRVCFMSDNQYLVKAFFTFGLRTVAPGTAHVYQTLAVPVLFYLMIKSKSVNLNKTERFFPVQDYYLYDRRILRSYGKYRVPAGTTYFILTTQKTLFAVDIVNDDFVLPFKYQDPVATRVSKLKEFKGYDAPVPTPFIGALDHEINQKEPEQDWTFQVPQAPQTFQYFLIPTQQQDFTADPATFLNQQHTSDPATFLDQQQDFIADPATFPPQQQEKEAPAQQQQEEEKNLDADEVPIEPLPRETREPINWEKNVTVASPDFVENFRWVSKKEYDRPPDLKKSKKRANEDCYEIALDLSAATMQKKKLESTPATQKRKIDEMLDFLIQDAKTPRIDIADILDDLLTST